MNINKLEQMWATKKYLSSLTEKKEMVLIQEWHRLVINKSAPCKNIYLPRYLEQWLVKAVDILKWLRIWDLTSAYVYSLQW